MIDLKKAKEYARIDYDTEDDFINELIIISSLYIDGMVGIKYKDHGDGLELAKILQLKLIRDMYETRSTFVPNSVKTDRITNSILDKLSNYE